MSEIRLHKFLATCGIGSRRKCEKYIEQGRIAVDGKIITEQGVKIDPNVNKITFNGESVVIEKKCFIMLNKPPKYICSSDDPGKRKSFLDLLPNNLGRLYTIGRLDFMSEGLLIVTNDGDLSYKISHPSFEVKKVYEVHTLEKLSDKDRKAKPKEKKLVKKRKRQWFEKFHWFFSTDGFLVIGGRDAKSNETLVKKHMEKADTFLHANIQGGAACVIKSQGKPIPKTTLQEAALFAGVFSKAWKEKLATIDVYAVNAENVSKKAPRWRAFRA